MASKRLAETRQKIFLSRANCLTRIDENVREVFRLRNGAKETRLQDSVRGLIEEGLGILFCKEGLYASTSPDCVCSALLDRIVVSEVAC